MSISPARSQSILVYDHSKDGGSIVINIPFEHAKEFKELVQRGTNLWPDASPDIKEFADLVTNGRILQDYRAQAGQLVPAKKVDGVLVEMSPVSLSSIQQP